MIALRRLWLPISVALLLASSAAAIDRLSGAFAADASGPMVGVASTTAEPLQLKEVSLEVFGDVGASATISYLDARATLQEVHDVALPWSITSRTTLPVVFTNLAAQGDGSRLGCRISVDGRTKDERVVDEVKAYTFCVVKSG